MGPQGISLRVSGRRLEPGQHLCLQYKVSSCSGLRDEPKAARDLPGTTPGTVALLALPYDTATGLEPMPALGGRIYLPASTSSTDPVVR